MDFSKGKSLEEKLEAMRHVNNIGREVGRPWGIEGVMRWDRNQVSLWSPSFAEMNQADQADWD
jgi:hypothetical protein